MQISLLIKNLWACWFDFDRSFVYTQISYDLKSNLKSRYNDIVFKKFLFLIFEGHFNVFFLGDVIHLCYWTFQIYTQLCSFWARENVCRHH